MTMLMPRSGSTALPARGERETENRWGAIFQSRLILVNDEVIFKTLIILILSTKRVLASQGRFALKFPKGVLTFPNLDKHTAFHLRATEVMEDEEVERETCLLGATQETQWGPG